MARPAVLAAVLALALWLFVCAALPCREALAQPAVGTRAGAHDDMQVSGQSERKLYLPALARQPE